MPTVLLYAPEYRPNLSNMIRSAEFYGHNNIYIYDQHGLLDPPRNKASRADMEHLARVWTAGAIEHIDIERIDDPLSFIRTWSGRSIATIIADDASALEAYSAHPDDLIIMGPEKMGLPHSIIECCDLAYYLSPKGHTDCLNVSVMLGIILYHAQLSLAKHLR